MKGSFSDSSYSYSYSESGTWLENFLQHSGFQHLLLQVPDTYLREPLALYGLERFPNYNDAFQLIVNNVQPLSEDIEQTAAIVYALAHSRYARTAQGLNEALDIFNNAGFGKCPRTRCGCNLLPYAPS